MPDTFPLDLLRAVSDWQRDPSAKKKIERGKTLKALSANLPERFRTCDEDCFRQEAQDKGRTWKLLLESKMPVTIAAWTTNLEIAEQLKGGARVFRA